MKTSPQKKQENISDSKRNEKINLKKSICSINKKSSVSRSFVDICKKRIPKNIEVKALFPEPSKAVLNVWFEILSL